LAGKQSSR